MKHPTRIIIGALLLLLASAHTLHAQMSMDDAQKRLRERLATRPATTQPMTEEDRLRAENTKLREENYALRQEVSSLREALDHLMHEPGAAGPTTRPAGGGAVAGPAPAQANGAVGGGGGGIDITGHYRGGSPDDGTAFLVTFKADGTYEQNWLMPPRSEPGQYQIDSDGTLEMWSDHAAPSAPHHLWRVSTEGNQVTLTPLLPNGAPSSDPPQVLSRTGK